MNMKRNAFLFLILMICLTLSGCQMLPVFQHTPLPLETATPQLSLNQVAELPTLPPIEPTPTLSEAQSVRYEGPGDIFVQVREEKLPEKAFQPVVIFGSVNNFITRTDEWGRTVGTGGFTLAHHSGTEFEINCDDFTFYIDARKNLVSSEKLTPNSEVIIFGASDEEPTLINADMIAIHVIKEDPVPREADLSGFPSNLTYNEYDLESFPKLNPISIQAAKRTATPVPAATEESTAEPAHDDYSYNYGYGYGYYGLPTSTPNRPQRTPTPNETGTPVPTPTLSLDDRLTDRFNHSLENRTTYAWGAYGEKYSSYIEYEQDLNRDPSHPTRAVMNVASNGYDFTEFWFPYVQNPMFSNWGVVCYAGDWYLPIRVSVDIDQDPNVVDVITCDRTIRTQKNYDSERGYIRSFGYSVLDRKLIYFYQKEDGYGISIDRQDYDLGFDDIPFGYIGTYSELDPFYADDLITFFGHRGDEWVYVEIKAEDPYGYY